MRTFSRILGMRIAGALVLLILLLDTVSMQVLADFNALAPSSKRNTLDAMRRSGNAKLVTAADPKIKSFGQLDRHGRLSYILALIREHVAIEEMEALLTFAQETFPDETELAIPLLLIRARSTEESSMARLELLQKHLYPIMHSTEGIGKGALQKSFVALYLEPAFERKQKLSDKELNEFLDLLCAMERYNVALTEDQMLSMVKILQRYRFWYFWGTLPEVFGIILRHNHQFSAGSLFNFGLRVQWAFRAMYRFQIRSFFRLLLGRIKGYAEFKSDRVLNLYNVIAPLGESAILATMELAQTIKENPQMDDPDIGSDFLSGVLPSLARFSKNSLEFVNGLSALTPYVRDSKKERTKIVFKYGAPYVVASAKNIQDLQNGLLALQWLDDTSIRFYLPNVKYLVDDPKDLFGTLAALKTGNFARDFQTNAPHNYPAIRSFMDDPTNTAEVIGAIQNMHDAAELTYSRALRDYEESANQWDIDSPGSIQEGGRSVQVPRDPFPFQYPSGHYSDQQQLGSALILFERSGVSRHGPRLDVVGESHLVVLRRLSRADLAQAIRTLPKEPGAFFSTSPHDYAL